MIDKTTARHSIGIYRSLLSEIQFLIFKTDKAIAEDDIQIYAYYSPDKVYGYLTQAEEELKNVIISIEDSTEE